MTEDEKTTEKILKDILKGRGMKDTHAEYFVEDGDRNKPLFSVNEVKKALQKGREEKDAEINKKVEEFKIEIGKWQNTAIINEHAKGFQKALKIIKERFEKIFGEKADGDD